MADGPKRLLDLLVSALGLLLLAPLLAAIALAIAIDAPGPVLFTQERVGRGGVPFRIHKFRTMRPAPDGAGGLPITVGADARITRVGRWLRRSKLDELPQLWDVLRGAMSLVGPRPEVSRYVALYPPELRALVLSVRPGLTDEASLASLDEAARLAEAADPEREYIEVLMPAKLALAAEYVRTRSFAGDLRILARTLGAVVGAGPGRATPRPTSRSQ